MTPANVQPLRPVEKEICREAEEYLLHVLTQVRAGEVRGVLIVAQDSTGVSYSVAGLKDRFAVTGFLTHAIHKLQKD